MLSKIKNKILGTRLLDYLIYKLVIAYSKTFKLEVENERESLSYIENKGRVIYCVWHQQFFGLLYYASKMSKYKPTFMVSMSNDGELIANVMKRLGWSPVRGSSSKKGKEALKALMDNFEHSRIIGHGADGPRGPIGKIKAGVIKLARETEAPIVPVYVSVDRYWRFNSWDRFFLPKPFAKVKIKFDNMICYEKSDDPESFEKQRIGLEKKMFPYLL